MLEAYMGFKGAAAQNNAFVSQLPVFWAIFGTIAGVVVSTLAGAYSGLATINGAVRTEFWTGKNSVFRSSYYVGYGGNGIVGGFLGALEFSWVALYLTLSTVIVLVPYFILSQLLTYLNTKLSSQANEIVGTYRLLGNAFLLAFGSWMSAWSMKLSVEKIIGWYDKQDTNPAATNSKVDNEISLIFDFLNHTAITLAYYTLSCVIAGATYGYVYGQLTDQSLTN